MGKRSAVVELFLGDMGSMQRELRPSIQREDQPTMETKLEQIAVKAVNQLPKSVVREIRTPRSVGAGGGQLPPATRWARGNSRPYRESRISGQSGPSLTDTVEKVPNCFVTNFPLNDETRGNRRSTCPQDQYGSQRLVCRAMMDPST
jgi:hypothetical protein